MERYNKTFEKLFIREESVAIFTLLYKTFDKNFKDYFFRDQILRATISVSNNIAEWYERQTNKELKYFLYIAKWSCWEIRSMIIIWKELWYVNDDDFNYIKNLTIEISKMLSWYIKNIKI